MVDFLLQALQKTKKRDSLDLNYALICAELANQAYNSPKRQTKFLTKYKFTHIKLVANQNAHVTLACHGNDLYVSIMGTDFSSAEDLENNADVTWTTEGIGSVHSGYSKHLDLIWDNIKAYIDLHDDKHIIICGHSMGGACGQIINYRIQNSIGYYFGSPRVIDKNILQHCKAKVFHMQNKYDVVPDLPPDIFGFKLLGQVYTIRKRKLLLKQPKWTDAVHSVFCTLVYFFISGVSKLFGCEDKLHDLVLINHEIEDYIYNVKSAISLVANQQ